MKIKIANALHVIAVVLFICIIATLLGGYGFNITGLSVSKMTTILVCATAVGTILKRDNSKQQSDTSTK